MSKSSHHGRRPHITALLIDISGTLHIGAEPTRNAVNAFHRLRESSIPFRLCSNTSKESSLSLVKRLEKMGFEVSFKPSKGDLKVGGSAQAPQQLMWTSIAAAAQVVKNMRLKKPLLLLSDSARKEVLAQLSEGDAYPNSYPAVDGESGNDHYDSVVVGLAPFCFDYDHLNSAFRVLMGENLATPHERPGNVPLIATHKAKYIQTEDGLSLGPGPFVTALETATGTTAHVIGKPTKEFFEMVIEDFRFAEAPDKESAINESMNDQNRTSRSHRGKIAVIGDDVEADLGGGALELGLWRVLVKTGKYRVGDEKRAGIVPPDEVCDSFADFVDSLVK